MTIEQEIIDLSSTITTLEQQKQKLESNTAEAVSIFFDFLSICLGAALLHESRKNVRQGHYGQAAVDIYLAHSALTPTNTINISPSPNLEQITEEINQKYVKLLKLRQNLYKQEKQNALEISKNTVYAAAVAEQFKQIDEVITNITNSKNGDHSIIGCKLKNTPQNQNKLFSLFVDIALNTNQIINAKNEKELKLAINKHKKFVSKKFLPNEWANFIFGLIMIGLGIVGLALILSLNTHMLILLVPDIIMLATGFLSTYINRPKQILPTLFQPIREFSNLAKANSFATVTTFETENKDSNATCESEKAEGLKSS